MGHLLKLRGSAAANHGKRRVREQYGERETVSRRVRYVLRSYLDWNVLLESKTQGKYVCRNLRPVDDIQLIAWLAQSSLHTRTNGTAPLAELFDGPSLFPFRIAPVHPDKLTATTASLSVVRHGLNNEIIVLSDSCARTRLPPCRSSYRADPCAVPNIFSLLYPPWESRPREIIPPKAKKIRRNSPISL